MLCCNPLLLWAQSDIQHTWVNTTDNATLSIAKDPLGRRFIYKKDTVHISGVWRERGDTLLLDYVFNIAAYDTIVKTSIDTVAVEGKPFPVLSRDTLFVPKTPLPLPKNMQFALNGDKLTITGSDGKLLQFQKNDPPPGSNILNNILRGCLGIASILAICWVASRNRQKIPWKVVLIGILVQFVFAFAILNVPVVAKFFAWVSSFFVNVLAFTGEGSKFLFGKIVDVNTMGFLFAFQVMPTIIFFSALTSILYYLGILQKIVYGLAWFMTRAMKLSGAESLSTAANIFLGQTEAPLMVKPYIANMTRSEILCVMVGGMANIAGSVFAAYVGFLGGSDPETQLLFATHLLSASIMSAPATIVVSKILLPEPDPSKLSRELRLSNDQIGSNLLDAITNGTTDGIKLAVNVAAMLLVFIALMALVNSILYDFIGYYTGLNDWIRTVSDGKYMGLRLEAIFGYLFSPLAWLLGVPAKDITAIGQLLGEKTIINEFVAYTSLGTMKDMGTLTDAKSIIIATYALCGFANFSSIGIQIGGIGALAPNQKQTLSELGILALIGGTAASFLTATIAGMLLG